MPDIILDSEDWVIEVDNSPIAVVEAGGIQGPSGAIALAEHVAAPDPHSQYATDSDLASGLAAKAAIGVAENLLADHTQASNPHSQYATDSDLATHTSDTSNPHGTTAAQVGADPIGTSAAAIAAHIAASNPHSQYLTQSELDTELAFKEDAGVAGSLFVAHTAATDPHSQYTNLTEVSDLIEGAIASLNLGTAATASTVSLRDRAAHTGTQAIDTVSGLTDALNSKANSNDGRFSDSRTPIDGSVTDAKIASDAAIDWSKVSKLGAAPGDVGAATAAQGATADSALQLGAIGQSVQGHRAILDTIDAASFATTAQGVTADTALQPEDIGVTIVAFDDARLSDQGVPLDHTQAWSTITATPTTLMGYGITDAATAAQGATAETALQPGEIGSTVAAFDDARLSDARPPTAHTQAWSTITATPTTLLGYGITDAATAVQGAIAETALQPGAIGSTIAAFNDARLSDQRVPIDASVTDVKIGDRTATDIAPTDLGPGTLTQWLGWLTNRIKAITGKANWWATPATTLEAAATHASSTSNPHNLTAAQIGALTSADWASPGAIGATPDFVQSTRFTATGAAGSQRQYRFFTGSSARWSLYANSDAEAGSNAGSSLLCSYYSDAGAYLGDLFSASRVSGGITFPNLATFAGAIAAKNINSTGTRIGLAPTSAPTGGGFRYDYTAGASIPLVSVGPSSNIQFGHGAAGMASAALWNSGGSLALQYDVVGNTAQGNVLLGTATNNGVDKLQVSGSGLFTGALKITDTTASVGITSGSFVTAGGAGIGGAIFTPGLIITPTGAPQTQGVGNGSVVGNARGTGAVDLQTTRTANTKIASGSYSVITGGSGNTASGDRAVVAGGNNNTASGIYASVAGGAGNVASGNYAFATGNNNTASGNWSVVPGGFQGVASRPNQLAFASGYFTSNGDAQYSLMVVRAQSTDATPKELFLDGSGATQRITIANNSSLTYQICVSAHSTTDRTKQAQFWRRGKIFKLTTAASTAIVAGEIAENQVGALAWTATISADTTNGSLKITVTGEAGVTIYWTATIQAVEITG